MNDEQRRGGDRLYGDDAGTYHRYRPGYPEALYDLLRDRCGLATGQAAFEVGAGTGQATRRLLEIGIDPLVVIEPDQRLADRIATDAATDGASGAIQFQTVAFEAAVLPDESFDLGLAATSFHWVDQAAGFPKVSRALRPGGQWAMWWNMFGDPAQPDPFHDATHHLFSWPDHGSYATGEWARPFPLDEAARRRDLAAFGSFDEVGFEILRWTITLDPTQVAGLYRTYSSLRRLPEAERERIIGELIRITDEEFGGRLDRDVLTPVYTARRI